MRYGPFAKIHRIEREREKRKKVPKEKNFCIVDRSAKNRNSFYFEYGGGYYALVPIKYFFFFSTFIWRESRTETDFQRCTRARRPFARKCEMRRVVTRVRSYLHPGSNYRGSSSRTFFCYFSFVRCPSPNIFTFRERIRRRI